MIDNSFNEFLLNDEKQVGEFETSVRGRVKVVKEVYDDRFNILYIKHLNTKGLNQNNYSVAGYYDKKDKCLYDSDFWLDNIILKDGEIKTNTFNNLKNKIIEEVSDSIKKYSLDNENKLKKEGLKKFSDTESWKIESYKKDVQRDFINTKDYNVDIYTSYVRYCYDDIMCKYNGDPYIDYLNNPQEFIKMCTDKVIEINKEEIAYELVVYNFKKEYLNKILKNTNQEFSDIYTCKKILNAIKKENFNPRTLRITINYNNKDFTFSYNYTRLVSDIRCGECVSYDYYKNYDEVSDFLKENKNCLENRYMEPFDLSHVKSITYGREELYHNDNISKIKVKTKEKER